MAMRLGLCMDLVNAFMVKEATTGVSGSVRLCSNPPRWLTISVKTWLRLSSPSQQKMAFLSVHKRRSLRLTSSTVLIWELILVKMKFVEDLEWLIWGVLEVC